ncbi:MAG: polyprenyl synthetase family protein [Chloroflexi bacterium]|nr:polyprenyl synthetase family protein [Chloroflexota bacterium]
MTNMEGPPSTLQIPSPLLRLSPLLEEALRAFFSQRSFPLYRLMEYQLGWRDERGSPLETQPPQPRLHAALCLLACEASGGEPREALPCAVAVELAYQFTQVHADIQEGSQSRHHRPTVWWVWGPAQAINAGDGLHALARLCLMGDREDGPGVGHSLQLLQTLDQACLRLCEGMYQEMVFQERVDIAPEAYLRMAREKVGALIGCALGMGALSAGADQTLTERWRAFGEEVGVALQVQEDIQSLWGSPLSGKDLGLDVLNKKKGYPIILAFEQASLPVKRELGTLFFKRVLEPPDVERVRAILDGLGARDKAQAAAADIYNKALADLSLSSAPDYALGMILDVARWLGLRA